MRKGLIAGLAVLLGLVLGVTAIAPWNGARQADERIAALAAPELPPIRGEEVMPVTTPPAVPPRVTRDYATKVVVNLTAVEKKMRIADGAEFDFWTFGGQVPGTFIRVREGDLVELHLHNLPDSQMAHNIDLHAVTGPGGGAKATITMPGGESVVTFRALKPGLFVYHCAMPGMVPMHIAHGMYGLILVQPKEGMPAVDHEYYVMQGDFYTKGDANTKGLLQFDHQRLVDENPSFVLLNGAVGALTGDHALQAKAGETVRLFVGNGGPNLVSSFHIIGEIMDNVFIDGGSQVNHNVQTTLIPSGGAAMAELRFEEPGDYLMLDHSISRAFNKGALGILHVDGQQNAAIFRAGAEPVAAR